MIVVAFSLFQSVGGRGGGNKVNPSGSSRIIDVDFFPQKESLFCGPASVQIIIVEIIGKFVSQHRIVKEVEYIEGVGSLGHSLKKPFEIRGISVVSIGRHSSVDELRKHVDLNHFSILNIRFDEDSNSGHFVVVIGYNQSGIFVHDPWPEAWGSPDGRDSGEAAFLGNELLRRLWSRSNNWALVVGEHSELSKLSTSLKEEEA